MAVFFQQAPHPPCPTNQQSHLVGLMLARKTMNDWKWWTVHVKGALLVTTLPHEYVIIAVLSVSSTPWWWWWYSPERSTSSSTLPPSLDGSSSPWQPWGCSSTDIASPSTRGLSRLARPCHFNFFTVHKTGQDFIWLCSFLSDNPKVPVVIAVTFTVVCFFIVGLSLYSDPWNTGRSFILTLTGVPVYYLTVYRYRLPHKWREIFSKLHQNSS